MTRRRLRVGRAASVASSLVLACAAALAATPAWTTRALHLRAGPGPGYPVVAVLAPGQAVEIEGCLAGYLWCDVQADDLHGWVYAGYLEARPDGAPVPLPDFGPQVGITIVVFVLPAYWQTWYVGQPWYPQWPQWWPPPPPRRHIPTPPQRPAAPQPPAAGPVPPGLQRPAPPPTPTRPDGPTKRIPRPPEGSQTR